MAAAPEIYDAAVIGDLDRVRELLSLDPASVNATDEYGFTPLHGVAEEFQLEMAEYLIAQGANVGAVNDSGITPLHLAAYPEVVELLVSHGATLEAKAIGGATPLLVASEHPERLEVMQKMLENGSGGKC
jgi:ankyrin repeat protein